MYINDILEAVPTKEKERVKTKLNIGNATSKGQVTTANRAQTPTDIPIQNQTRAQTRQAQMNVPGGAAQAMSDFMNRTADVTDEIPGDAPTPDVEFGLAEPEPPEPTTLPVVQSQAVTSTEFKNQLKKLRIKWHKINNLPGYAIEQIRGAFRPLFNSVLGAELENISVTTTLDRQTSDSDLKSLIGWLGKYAIKDDNFNLEAFDIHPDVYNISNAYVYSLRDASFLILEEQLMGNTNYYIYTAKGRGTELSGEPNDVQQLNDLNDLPDLGI